MNMNIRLKFNQFFILINRKPINNLFKIICNYFFEQFIAIGYIYKTELSKIKDIPDNKDFEFKIMNESDLNIMKKKYSNEFNEERYLNTLLKLKMKNVDGFIVKKGEDICGYFLLAYGESESEIEKKYLNLNKNGYLFSDYVFEIYRDKKIHQYSIYKRLMILKEKKFETATSKIERTGIPSIKSYEKFGFRRYLIKIFFRFGQNIRSNSIIKPYKK